MIKASERPAGRKKINPNESKSSTYFKSQPNWQSTVSPDKHNKIKSCAISVQGETRLSPVRSASEANPEQVLCEASEAKQVKSCASSIRGELNQIKIEKGKIQKTTIKKKKSKKSKIKNQKSKIKKKKKREFVFSIPGQNMRLLSLPYS